MFIIYKLKFIEFIGLSKITNYRFPLRYHKYFGTYLSYKLQGGLHYSLNLKEYFSCDDKSVFLYL